VFVGFSVQVVLQLARSNNRVKKPYLMLQVSKICCDTAVMEYGPAIQASIGAIHLIDKIHTGCSGEYLELISTDSAADMITLLYRKVRAESDLLHSDATFEVLTVVKFQFEVFAVVTQCSIAVGYQHFGEPSCLHLQGGSTLKKGGVITQKILTWMHPVSFSADLRMCP